MGDKDSKAPIYLAIIISVILIAAGGYYVLGGKSASSGKEEKKTEQNLDSSVPYVFINFGNGVIEIDSKNFFSKQAKENFNSINKGLGELRLKCNVVSYSTLQNSGTTVGYTVIVSGACNVG